MSVLNMALIALMSVFLDGNSPALIQLFHRWQPKSERSVNFGTKKLPWQSGEQFKYLL